MRGDSGRSVSPSFATAETPPRPRLPGDARVDVCVIGAGMAGLSTAYHLTAEGRRVLVLDDGPIGGGQTGRTTAHLSNAVDDLYQTIETTWDCPCHGSRLDRYGRVLNGPAVHDLADAAETPRRAS